MERTTEEVSLLDRNASELVVLLARGEVSARALCDAAISRIERRDAALNAVVVRDFERAREQAAAADEALARGERGALLGLPMTVKESFDVAGLATTWGVESARGRVAERDAACVERLKRAGAVIVGKTNVSVRLGDWQAVNPIYGRTLHPRDSQRTPGGSSGGSAVAIATNMVPLELGSDIGGSIRVPASFCGVYGHMPSFDLVPTRGHEEPGSDGAGVELGVVGPIARSADDLELALRVLAGPDGARARAHRIALSPPRNAGELRGARLLMLDSHPIARTDRAIAGALGALRGKLEREGASVATRSELLPELGAAHRIYTKMLNTILGRRAGANRRTPSAYEWFDLLDERERLRRRWSVLFERYDAVIAPAFGTYAFPHVDEADWSARTLRIDDEDTPYGAQLAWPGVATLPGLPATAVPIGATESGLSLGAQVIGPMFEDLTPIAFARGIGALRE